MEIKESVYYDNPPPSIVMHNNRQSKRQRLKNTERTLSEGGLNEPTSFLYEKKFNKRKKSSERFNRLYISDNHPAIRDKRWIHFPDIEITDPIFRYVSDPELLRLFVSSFQYNLDAMLRQDFTFNSGWLMRRLVGEIFENLALAWVSSQGEYMGKSILTEKQTDIYLQKAGLQTADKKFKRNTIPYNAEDYNRYKPDGLKIGNPMVFFEATTKDIGNDYITKKIKTCMRFIIQSGIVEDVKLVIIGYPSNDTQVKKYQKIGEQLTVEFIEVPWKRRFFGHIFNRMYHNMPLLVKGNSQLDNNVEIVTLEDCRRLLIEADDLSHRSG